MDTFRFEIVANPEIFQENRMMAHSDHEFYSSKEKANGVSDLKYLLNGVWKFAYAKNYASAQKGFEALEFDCRDWDTIRVPAHIQLEGYDIPAYVNTQYPWEGHDQIEPGEIPTSYNPVAEYVKYFEVPDFMKGKPVYISFQGVESGFALWCNGKYVGYSEDSFTPSEFDLTDFVVDGENKLALMVFKWTAGSWCEDQDFFRFSGIFRDVYLYTTPSVHVRDLKLRTLIDDDYKDAVLEVSTKSEQTGDVNIRLLDGKDEVASTKAALNETVKIDIVEPKLWSAEEPKLYDIELCVLDEAGNVVEYIIEKIGFRRFEMKDTMMHLNGKRIVFNGVNRHEFCSQNGRVLSDEDIEKDIITMKQNNINAIRTSHYPNKTTLYRLADIYGLYLIDEANLETHGVWDAILNRKLLEVDYSVPGDRPEYQELIIDRARNMYERDKNHTCILIWSCGNESFGGKDLLEMSNCYRKWDDTRLVHYEGVDWDKRYPETTDMVSTMYRPVADIKEYLKDHRDKPFINCEYSHAMGNSCGSINKYVQLTEDEPLYQGGFIWDYIDQSLTLFDRHGVSFQGYGGDFGDRPCDYSFSGNGIAYGENRDPSPKMQEVKFVYANIKVEFVDGKMLITNKNLFVNTNTFDCIAKLEKEGKLIEEKRLSYEVEPLSSKTFDLPIDAPSCEGEFVLTVSFVLKQDEMWAKKGHEVAYGQTTFGSYVPSAPKTGTLKLVEGWCNLGVKGDDFEAIFSTIHGGLVSYKYGNTELFKAIPKPNFWRPMTENDIANLLPFRAGQWKLASMYVTHKFEDGRNQTAYEITKGNDSVTITYTYHIPVSPVVDCKMAYKVYPDGTIRVSLDLPKSDDVGEIPEFGAIFTMDADYENLKWYGAGPMETYCDKWHGKLGVYKNKVADNVAKYLVPQECGNKIDVRYAEITDMHGKGIRIEGEKLNLSALPYSPHEIDCATHPTELPPVHYTFIRVAKEQMGIAGDDTWGAKTHPEYLIDNSKPMHLEFTFKGL